MSATLLYAFGSLLAWTVGDFLIQKSVRKVGVTVIMLAISWSAVIALFPFIRSDLGTIFTEHRTVVLLLIAGLSFTLTSFFDFKALRQGKLAIIEPIFGLELPVTIALSVTLAGEQFSLAQILLMLSVFIGIVLTVTSHYSHLHYHKRMLEKGALIAGLAAVVTGLTNFLVGTASESSDPLVAMWCISVFVGIVSLAFTLVSREKLVSRKVIIRNIPLILSMCIIDNVAWIFYAMATGTGSIAIVTTITESYIALTVLLGIFINKERVKRHQIIGIAIAVIGMIALSAIS